MAALLCCTAGVRAQEPARASDQTASTLERVVLVSRHGVRSPLQSQEQLAQYSHDPWPVWPVAPGLLTPHGRALMTTLGRYDAEHLRDEGLLRGAGCASAGDVYVWSDTDERDLSTSDGWLAGLLPDCSVPVHRVAGTANDPMIHPLKSPGVAADRKQALAEVLGRVGGNGENLRAAHLPALLTLDRILGGCGPRLCPGEAPGRSVLPLLPIRLAAGSGDHLLSEGKGALSAGSTLSEILLLEYAEGMPMEQVGFGRASRTDLAEALQLHSTYVDLGQETDYPARVQGSDLLAHVLRALLGERSAGEAGRAGERVADRPAFQTAGEPVVFVAAHDTNLAQLAGMLRLHWYLPGDRQDATPPGGALLFELRRTADGHRFVRVRFRTQSLEQMRQNTPLHAGAPPDWADITVPGCAERAVDYGCPVQKFKEMVNSRVLVHFVTEP